MWQPVRHVMATMRRWQHLLVVAWLAGSIALLLCHEHSSQTLDRFLFPHHFSTKFREAPPPADLKAWFANRTVRVMTLCYNAKVPVLREKINHLLEGCGDWRVYLGGLDSTRRETLEDLRAWYEGDPQHVVLVPVDRTRIERTLQHFEKDARRTNRLAELRNTLTEYCRQVEPQLPGDAIVLVYDGDHWGPMSRNGMMESMRVLVSASDALFAVSSKGCKSLAPGLIYVRYDWYAYTPPLPGMALPPTVPNHIHPVLSSFSGSAVYLWKDYRLVRYGGGRELCEHKVLHQCLHNLTGRIMGQNHQWTLYVGGDHSNP
eukprot:GGOE01014244.1.p1 GENE.GGOE01014244.1~~GGOE01014244.1.p1  ORF type:complete len:317 (+),score=76.45 GGOE01014244.1:79-1029(+)